MYRSLGIFSAIFCFNPHIIQGDMKENVSGCFFLNTEYIKQDVKLYYN